jgi:hypothetical protein
MNSPLENPLFSQKKEIKPLHTGFGFGAQEILKNFREKSQKPSLSTPLDSKSPCMPSLSQNFAQSSSPFKEFADHQESLSSRSSEDQHRNSEDQQYHVPSFFAFLAWSIDSLIGFCFLMISLCLNFVFIPKGFIDIWGSFFDYALKMSLNLNLFYTFLFSVQVWFVSALFVFLFQYTMLGFESATLGRWLFGIAIQNHKNKKWKVAEKTKVCAALSESLLLGSLFSFLFVLFFPSRVPLFFWMRYSLKKQ